MLLLSYFKQRFHRTGARVAVRSLNLRGEMRGECIIYLFIYLFASLLCHRKQNESSATTRSFSERVFNLSTGKRHENDRP